MLSMKLLLLLLLVPVAFGQSIEERVKKFDQSKAYKVVYDKFEKETRVTYHGVIDGRGGWIAVEASVWIADSGNTTYFLRFEPSRRTLYDNDRLRLLLDGKLLDVKDVTDIEYHAFFMLTADEFQQITNAKTAEMQLRWFEGKFGDKTLAAFRNLASLTKPER